MVIDELFWRRGLVFASGIVYWAGVLIQARRVRRHIGRSPNIRPRGAREKLLWAGWLLVILFWMGQPFLVGGGTTSVWLRFFPALLHPLSFALGIVLCLAGYAATLWCYAIMGDTWRIGINQDERNTLVTRGPYRLVRHPIYLFQVVMLVGAVLLLPTWLSLAVLVFHLLCVMIKAADEESYLLTVHGQAYRDYVSRTGSLFPKFSRVRSTD
jgi:protein-S-isoprenylcysteine O-methyltransferase Ste14